MFRKLLILSSAITLALSFGARADDNSGCRNGVQVSNGHPVLDANGYTIPCGVPVAAVDTGVDPALLAVGAGAAVVVGGGVAIALASSHHNNPASP